MVFCIFSTFFVRHGKRPYTIRVHARDAGDCNRLLFPFKNFALEKPR